MITTLQLLRKRRCWPPSRQPVRQESRRGWTVVRAACDARLGYCISTELLQFPTSCRQPVSLHSDHDTRIFIPAHQRVVTVLGARLCDIRPACHEILMRVCARKFACDGGVHGLHDLEVGGEEDVEVALVDLQQLVDCRGVRQKGRTY